MFDKTCQKLVCVTCYLTSHKSHDMADVLSVVAEKRQHAAVTCEASRARVRAIEQAEGELDAAIARAVPDAEQAERDIDEAFEKVKSVYSLLFRSL